MTEKEAKEIVDNIIMDIESRRGLGDEWDMIDGEIQEEIKQTWMNLIYSKPKLKIKIEDLKWCENNFKPDEETIEEFLFSVIDTNSHHFGCIAYGNKNLPDDDFEGTIYCLFKTKYYAIKILFVTEWCGDYSVRANLVSSIEILDIKELDLDTNLYTIV